MGNVKNPTTLFGAQGTEEPKTFSANGEFYSPPGVKYNPITVAVPEAIHDTPFRITRNGEYEPDDDERYTPIVVDVRDGSVDDEAITITENGFYRPDEGKRFNPVVVSVPGVTPEDVGKTITENGIYQAPDGVRFTPITVDVPQDVEDEAKTITANGTYSPYSGKRFNPLTVAVPVPVDQAKTITENGRYVPDEGKRFSEVTVNIPIMTSKSEEVTANGSYTIEPDDIRYKGMRRVNLTVDVPDPPSEAHTFTENGTFEVPEGKVYGPITVAVPIETGREYSISENGQHTINPSSNAYAGMDSVEVTVNVPQYDMDDETKTITSNGTYYPEEGKRFNPVHVNVPSPSDSSKVITENGMYEPPDGTRWNPIHVQVPQDPYVDQPKNFNQNGVYHPGEGERYNPIYIQVPIPTTEAHTYTSNGTFTVPDGKLYNPINVSIPVVERTYSMNGEYHIPRDEICHLLTVNVPQPTEEAHTFTENGTFEVPEGKLYSPITVNVQGGGGDVPIGETLRSMLLMWLDGINNIGEDLPHADYITTWFDLSGNDHNCRLNGGSNFASDHLYFGGNIYANCGSLNPLTYTLEIALSFSLDDLHCVFSTYPADASTSISELRYAYGDMSFDFAETSIDLTPPAVAEKAVITVVVGDLNNSNNVKVFINGVLSSTGTVNSKVKGTADFLLGVRQYGPNTYGEYMIGNIYSVRLWSAGFSDSIVAELAAETMERFNIGGQTA